MRAEPAARPDRFVAPALRCSPRLALGPLATVLIVLLATSFLFPRTARAQDLKDRFNGRVALMGLGLIEQPNSSMTNLNEASQYQLGWGDLRVVLDGRRLPGKFELHVDARIRMTGQLTPPNKRDPMAMPPSPTDTTPLSRGYTGGREYEVREVFARRRGEKLDFAIGRMFVSEADGLRVDGLRGWWRFHKHWDGSLYLGALPNPFSRSILNDYVSGGATAVGGLTFSYTYDRIWGRVGAAGAYLGGNDDGGALVRDAATMMAAAGMPKTEATRSFITWTNYWRAASWLEIYSDLVLDVAGAAGVQVTRANFFLNGHFGPATVRLGYNRMSSYALEMYMLNLLSNRGTFLPGTIENNLVVMRTARDEGRLDFDYTFRQKTSIYVNGALRRRYALQVGDDASFASGGNTIAPGLAYDATAGVRDRGSLAGIRVGAAYTFLGDYRATNHIVRFDLGRSFANDKFAFDLYFAFAKSKDAAAGNTMPCMNFLDAPCYGKRDGNTYEVGLTLTSVPWRKLFLLLDYRFLADTMSGTGTGGGAIGAILTHVILLRAEFRF